MRISDWSSDVCSSDLRNERTTNRRRGRSMPLGRLIEYEDASDEVRAVYDDIMASRKTDWVNNFWKALAQQPDTLRRTWESVKQVMAPGALDPLTKELLYVAVSVTKIGRAHV